MKRIGLFLALLILLTAMPTWAQVNVGGLRPVMTELDDFDDTTGWAVLNDDAANIATDTDHVEGTNALEVDKANGTADTLYGLMDLTITSVNLATLGPAPMLSVRYNLPSYADATHVVVRLGTSDAAYNEFRCAVAGTAGQWQTCHIALDSESGTAAGAGWNSTAITYFAIGALFGAETDTLVDMLFDQTIALSGMALPNVTSVTVSNTVTVDGSAVTQPVSGTVTANLSATDNAVLDDIANGIPLDANSGVDIGDVDVLSSALPTGAATSALQTTGNTSLSNIDTDTTTIAAGVATEGSALGSGVLLQGDDGTDRTNVLVDVAGHVQVDTVTTALPTGAATAANQLADGHNVTVDNGAAGAAVNIQDGGNTITVDGTVTSNLSATDNAVLDDIANGIPLDANSGVDIGDVDVLSMPADATELPAAALMADDLAIATTPQIAAVQMCHDSVGGNIDFCDVSDGGSGAATANTARTIAATDSPEVTALEIIDDAVAAEGAALGSGVLMQGDDGTDRTNVLVDAAGHLQIDVLSGGGAGTEYTEDDAAPANPVGGAVLLVRDDAASGQTSLDGDMIAQRATDYGAAFVQVLDSAGAFVDSFGGSGGTAQGDNTAVGQLTPIGALYDVTPPAITDGNVGFPRMDSNRFLMTILQSNSGVDIGDVDILSIAAGNNDIGNVDLEFAGTAASVNAGVNTAQTQRVTLATDDELNDDADTIAAGYATEGSALGSGVLLQGDDGTDRTNVLVDAAGHLQIDVLTGGGGGTQYTFGTDTYTETTNIGTMAGAVRNDTLATLVNTDNEIAPLQVDSAGALYVDGSQYTQPISAASLPLPTGAATSANQLPDGHQVTLDLGGVVAVAGSGINGTGVQRVTLATDDELNDDADTIAAGYATEGSALGSGVLLQGDDGTDRTNVLVDVAGHLQIDVLTSALPTGAATSANQLANGHDVTVDNVVGNPVQVEIGDGTDTVAVLAGGEMETDMTTIGGTAVVAPRCMREEPTYISINQTGGTQLAAGTASERIYICSFNLISATAQNVALVSGTGSVCATSPSGVIGFGGSTAATGYNLAANSGIALAGSMNPYGETDTDADNLCLLQSGAGQVSGGLTYVSQ